jgi:hypothetical protein
LIDAFAVQLGDYSPHFCSQRLPALAFINSFPNMRLVTAYRLVAFAISAGISTVYAETFNGVPVEVLGRSVVVVPNGTVTYLRIRPPVFPTQPSPPPPAPEVPLSAEAQAALELEASKTYETLSVTATVYTRADGSAAVTELTWREGERTFRAWSNADFRLLAQLSEIETASHRFLWSPFVSEISLAELPSEQSPAGLALFPVDPPADTLPEYYFEGSEADAASVAPTLAALDWLHAHYYLHKTELAADLARREAEAAEQARLAAEAAAKPRHEKIYFWKVQ